MNYRNLALFVVALVLTVGAGGIWIAYTNASQKAATNDTNTTNVTTTPPAVAPKTQINESPDVLVGFDQDNATLAMNDSMDVMVKLDSSGTGVQTVQLVLKFDPAVIRVNSIAGTGLFDLYLGDQVDPVAGVAQISGAATGDKRIANDPSFARINISRISAGTTELTVAHPTSQFKEDSNAYTQVLTSPDAVFSVPEKSLTIN